MATIVSEITVDEAKGTITTRQWEVEEPLEPGPGWRAVADPAAPLVLPGLTPLQLRKVK